MSQFKPMHWGTTLRQAATSAELGDFLATHPGWILKNGALEKVYHFGNYFETMAYANAVAWVAHRQDHHPDMTLSYNSLVLRWNTHDAGGVSNTDFACAQACDALLLA